MTEPTDDLTGTVVQIDGADRTVGPELGSGHEGFVYTLEGVDNRVIKTFPESKQPSKKPKVSAMVDAQPADPNRNATGVPAFVWPSALVHDQNSGAFLGYAMPKLDLDQYVDAQKHSRDTLEWGGSAPEKRAQTALNLAAAVGLLHAQGHAIGDLNHQNVLVSDPYVTLIDCDGFHVGGAMQEYAGTTYHPRYSPPTKRNPDQPLQQTVYSDRFGLAVHVFQLLMEGVHPFSAVGDASSAGTDGTRIADNRFPYHDSDPGTLEPPPYAPDYDTLPGDVRDLFQQCFVYGKTRPRHRPSARDWMAVLSDMGNVEIGDESGEPQERWERKRRQRRRAVVNTDGGTPSSSSGSGSTNTAETSADGGRDRGWLDDIRHDATDLVSETEMTSSRSSTAGGSHSIATRADSLASHAQALGEFAIRAVVLLLIFIVALYVGGLLAGVLT